MHKLILIFIFIFFSLDCYAQNTRYYKKHHYYSELKSVPFFYIGVPVMRVADNHQYQPLLFLINIPYNLQIYDKGKAALDLIFEPQYSIINIYDQQKMESEFGVSIGLKPRFKIKDVIVYVQPTIGAQYVSYESNKIVKGLNTLFTETIGIDYKIKKISISSQIRYRQLINSKQGSNNLLFLIGIGYSFL